MRCARTDPSARAECLRTPAAAAGGRGRGTPATRALLSWR